MDSFCLRNTSSSLKHPFYVLLVWFQVCSTILSPSLRTPSPTLVFMVMIFFRNLQMSCQIIFLHFRMTVAFAISILALFAASLCSLPIDSRFGPRCQSIVASDLVHAQYSEQAPLQAPHHRKHIRAFFMRCHTMDMNQLRRVPRILGRGGAEWIVREAHAQNFGDHTHCALLIPTWGYGAKYIQSASISSNCDRRGWRAEQIHQSLLVHW